MVRYCKRCLFPDTKPDLYFNEAGICDSCLSSDRKHGVEDAIDWSEREAVFESILKPLRGSEQYNCLVPVSGGKDSTWQAYAMKEIHGMKPLAVTFDQFDQTETGRENLEVLKSIGVDHIHFTLNPRVVTKLIKKGFETVGDPYWVNHVGMFSVPFNIATKFNIPLIVYGENPQLEYGGPEKSRDAMIMDRRWRQEFSGMRGFREDDMLDGDVSRADLDALRFPSDDEVAQTNLRAVFYGYFFKWDAAKHIEVCKQLGWKPLKRVPYGSWVDYENCDMQFIDIREHIKYLKFGYGRATDQLNIEIRNRRISRSEALNLAIALDGRYDLENKTAFCRYLNITEEYFENVIDSYVNRDIFEKKDSTWQLKEARE